MYQAILYLVLALTGLAPALIARSKGRNFVVWWIYGALLFPVALLHAILLNPDYRALEHPQATHDLNQKGPIVNPFCILYVILLGASESLLLYELGVEGTGPLFFTACIIVLGAAVMLLSFGNRIVIRIGTGITVIGILFQGYLAVMFLLFSGFLWLWATWFSFESALFIWGSILLAAGLYFLSLGFYVHPRRHRFPAQAILLAFIMVLLLIGRIYFAGGPKLPESALSQISNAYIRKEAGGLFSWYPGTRIVYARRLAHCPGYSLPAVPFLISMLGDNAPKSSGDSSVYTPGEAAARTLGAIGKPAIGPLLAVMKNENIASSFAPLFPDRRHIPSTGLNTRSVTVRKNALTALASMARLMNPAVNQELLDALHDPDLAVRIKAAREMTDLYRVTHDPRIPYALGDLLRDKAPEVQKAAASTLLSLTSPPYSVDPRVMEILIGALAEGGPNEWRTQVEDRMRRFFRNVPVGRDPALWRKWWDASKMKYINFLEREDYPGPLVSYALRHMRDPFSPKELAGVLAKGDVLARRSAAWMLGEIKAPGAVAPLIGALQDQDKRVVLDAIDALGKLKDPRAVAPLIAVMSGKARYYSERPEMALEKITGRVFDCDAGRWKKWWQADRNEFLADREKYIRKHLDGLILRLANKPKGLWVNGSGQIFMPVPVVDPQRWRSVIQSIGEPAVCPLINALDNTNPVIRHQAEGLLARSKDFRAVGPLMKMLKTDSSVSGDLKELTGARPGFSDPLHVERWRQWWKDNRRILPRTPPLAEQRT